MNKKREKRFPSQLTPMQSSILNLISKLQFDFICTLDMRLDTTLIRILIPRSISFEMDRSGFRRQNNLEMLHQRYRLPSIVGCRMKYTAIIYNVTQCTMYICSCWPQLMSLRGNTNASEESILQPLYMCIWMLSTIFSP